MEKIKKISNTEIVLNDAVVGNWDAPMVDLRKASLVNQVVNCFQVGVSPCNVRLCDSQHLDRRLIQLHKDTVVDLTQTEELQDLNKSSGKPGVLNTLLNRWRHCRRGWVAST